MKPEERILFTNVPKLSQLTYFLVLIDFTEDQNIFSDFNWQKAKTRYLIQNEKDILAAPVERKISYTHLIVSKNYKDTLLKKLMEENNVTLLGPYSIQKDIYLKSLFNTLTVRISSEWVLIDKFLVKACFLSNKKIVEGVQLRLSLTDDCLSVFVKAFRLKLPLISLIDLGVDTETLYNNGFAVINQKVYVLPSFRQATAIFVHSNIPSSCPFRDYESMKNHWRDLYGYILPHTNEGMLYVEVNFDGNSASYLYPITCVCSNKPMQLKFKNDFEIITEFLDAWRKCFASICGYPICINLSKQPVVKFQLASKIQEEFEVPLLTQFISSITPSPSILPRKQDEPFKCFPIFNPQKKVNCNTFRSPTSKTSVETQVTVNKENFSKLSLESFLELEESDRLKKLKNFKLPDLIKFCRGNKIPVKAKDRKELVIQKIYSFSKFLRRINKSYLLYK